MPLPKYLCGCLLFPNTEALLIQSEVAGLPRDFYLDQRDLCNIESKIDGAEWKAASDEAQSVRLWADMHPTNVLHYSEFDEVLDKPFEIVVTRPELLTLLVEHGHNRPLFIDSTFGTNTHKVMLEPTMKKYSISTLLWPVLRHSSVL